jgi:hypothetical protein
MSNLPRNATLKSFIKICKIHGLDQDSKDIKIEDHTLDLEVVRLKQHIWKVTKVKEETQKLPEHKSNNNQRIDTTRVGIRVRIKCTSKKVHNRLTLQPKD